MLMRLTQYGLQGLICFRGSRRRRAIIGSVDCVGKLLRYVCPLIGHGLNDRDSVPQYVQDLLHSQMGGF